MKQSNEMDGEPEPHLLLYKQLGQTVLAVVVRVMVVLRYLMLLLLESLRRGTVGLGEARYGGVRCGMVRHGYFIR